MDRKHYDTRVLSVFDSVGSFFVDIFYNAHYLRAMKLVKSGQARSITDSYRSIVINYMSGITDRQDLYMSVAKKLHDYYQVQSGFRSVTFSDFENKVLSQFIPPEYYKDFSDRHKDTILRNIIVASVADFGKFILSNDMMKRTMDDHMNRNNITILQDKIVDIFILQREEYYAQFAQEIVQKNGGDRVSKRIVEKLRGELDREKKNSSKLQADNVRAVNMIQQLTRKIQDDQLGLKVLQKQVQQLHSQLSAAQNEIKNCSEFVVQKRTIDPLPLSKTTISAPVEDLKLEWAVDNVEPSESCSSSEDTESIYQKQQEQLRARRAELTQKPTEQISPEQLTMNLDDDPWIV